MTIAQLNSDGAVSFVRGKKVKTKTTISTSRDTVSTNGVNRPMLQRAVGRDCLRHRRSRTQLIEIRYDDSRAAVPSDMMALKATEDPMLIKDRRETITKLTQRAFSGTVNVLLT